jgi:hypothetical protein
LHTPSLRFMHVLIALVAIAALALVRLQWPQIVD